ncbi:hypothetical protein BJ508DRAFT_335912, partial [Ascobolus immersus RN42]
TPSTACEVTGRNFADFTYGLNEGGSSSKGALRGASIVSRRGQVPVACRFTFDRVNGRCLGGERANSQCVTNASGYVPFAANQQVQGACIYCTLGTECGFAPVSDF